MGSLQLPLPASYVYDITKVSQGIFWIEEFEKSTLYATVVKLMYLKFTFVLKTLHKSERLHTPHTNGHIMNIHVHQDVE